MTVASPNPLPRFALAKEPKQRFDDAAVRADENFIDGEPPQEMLAGLALVVDGPVERAAHFLVAGVHVDGLAGLGIDEARQPDVRQLELTRVFDRDRDDV